MLPLNLFHRIILHLNRRHLIGVFAVILKDDPAAQPVRNLLVLFRVKNNRPWKPQDHFSCCILFRCTVLHGKMQIIRKHTDHHLMVVLHLAFNMIIICPCNQHGQIHKLRGKSLFCIVRENRLFSRKELYCGSLWVSNSIDFLDERKELFRHRIDKCLHDLIPKHWLGESSVFRHVTSSLVLDSFERVRRISHRKYCVYDYDQKCIIFQFLPFFDQTFDQKSQTYGIIS